ncbi:unnamed protein product [Dracunculus medinensis]|uniref:4-hydroxybenzoate polyprenyltransferase, mitochondrial n=1 Tax=Dracunculus medinensis TaxID=318479 RepID=A0A0N4U1H7_DRAME|nr:unnamed protein product [Dracunculus medinensis]
MNTLTKLLYNSILLRNKVNTLSSSRKRSISANDLVNMCPTNIQPYLRLMRVDKPTGTWLLYWPCTWSIGLAAQAGCFPDLKMLALFGAGSFFMRSSACIINDIFDKEYDRKVKRTATRPLACGELNDHQAIVLLGGLLSVSLAILLQLNWFSVAIGASSLILTILYPFAKRYTYWPQLVLGFTLNWGVLIAWAHLCPNTFLVVTPLYIATVLHTLIYDTIYILFYLRSKTGLTFNWGAILGWCAVRESILLSVVLPLYIASINWTLIYDTIYAHQDKADDIVAGVKSTALLFGDRTKHWLSGFGAIVISGLAITGKMVNQTWPYYFALTITALQLSWQIGFVNINDPKDCWNKFASNRWLGAILFCGIIAGNLLKEREQPKENSEIVHRCEFS